MLLWNLLFACGEPPVVDAETVREPRPAAPSAPQAEPEGIAPPQADGESVTMPLRGMSVNITAHRLGERPVWTLLTEGLPREEVAFTVLRDPSVDLNPLLMFVQSAFDQGIRGAPGPWEVHGMASDGPGFLGARRYYTVYFLPPLALPGVEGADQALVGVLFDAYETEWLYRLGPQRLLGRLGRAYDQFPTAIWGDPGRPVLVPPDANPGPLAEVPTLPAASLEVTEIDGALRIGLGQADLDRLDERGSLARPGTLRLFGGYAPDVRGRVFLDLAGQPAVGGDAAGPLALNGLLVDVGPERVERIGDLARVTLPAERWSEVWQAARQRTSLSIGSTTLRFVEPGFPVAAPPPEPEAKTAAAIARFEVPMSETDLKAVIDEEALRTMIGLMEIELIAYATEKPAPVPSMHVGVLVQPDGSLELTPQFISPPEDGSWWPGLEAALRTVKPPATQRPVPVRLVISFR